MFDLNPTKQNKVIMHYTKKIAGYLLIATTILFSSCDSGLKDIDGNSYKIVKIGTRIWMAENLNVSRFRNGDSIPEVKSSEEWIKLGQEGKPACCKYQYDSEKAKVYGKLYNWFALNDPRGLAPKGWHVSTDEEWTELINFMGGGVIAALNMRSVGAAESGNTSKEGAFLALPGGCSNNNGAFSGIGSYCNWWSSTGLNTSSAWMRQLNCLKCDITSLGRDKIFGFSVRCIKN